MSRLKKRRQSVGDYKLKVDNKSGAVWTAHPTKSRRKRILTLFKADDGWNWWAQEGIGPSKKWLGGNSDGVKQHTKALEQAYSFMKRDSR